MSYFAPNLIPGHYMIDALIASEDFYLAIRRLEPRLASHLLYVEKSNSVILAPLHCLASVDKARKAAETTNPQNSEYVRYLRDVTGEWMSIIAIGSIDHPQRKMLLTGIHRALTGDLPQPPAWLRYIDTVLATGDDNTVHVRAISTLSRKLKAGGLGASSETAYDVNAVLAALGYGTAVKIKTGRKSK